MSDARADDFDSMGPPPSTRLWWIVPAAAFFILVTLSLLLGKPPDRPVERSSYAATDGGYRALFLVFGELGIPVDRTRRAGGSRGGPRWLLSPNSEKERDIDELSDWIRRGGQLLLATDDAAFAERLGVPIRTTTNPIGVEPLNETQRTYGKIGDRPLASIHSVGQGSVWLLHRPEMLTNAELRNGDHAVQAVQLAEAMRAEQPGPIAFDEFFHGLRDQPGVTQLLFQFPALPVTLQALALMVIVVWHFWPRFGTIRSLPPPDRRSKQEFLDAMSGLLERRGDYDDAFRTVQFDLVHRIETALGVPAGRDIDRLVAEAVRRRGGNPKSMARLLSAAGPPRGAESAPQSFVSALQELRTIDHEFFANAQRAR